MKVLIDTNVIIDAITGRTPYNASAEQIFLLAAKDQISATITASSVTDIYYLINKHFHDADKAKQVLRTIFTLFDVIDVGKNDCEKALDLLMTDYEDALLACCAKRTKARYIVTRNTKDFLSSPVQVIMPDDFISRFFLEQQSQQ